MKVLKVYGLLLFSALIISVNQVAFATNATSQSINHTAWDKLLKENIQTQDGGKSTTIDYQAMMRDKDKLTQYLNMLAGITEPQFNLWSKQQQLAFLINAYNAATVALILTAWPDIESIKELGSWYSSPWSKEFIPLLGKTRTLDDIEHNLIRGAGRYNDPRIHFAVNCASIGCPALRAEAYDGDKLDKQLDQQTLLFLSDSKRNYIDGETIKLSSIFKWYREDFEKGWRGFFRLEDFLLAHAAEMGISKDLVEKLRTADADIDFIAYDWRLNAKR
ncbi:DUF547 domain-containing protein [Dasania sp. GY-MA-18]|uniref:DUF547 domain-containing protein n=1 Tax=Dasania phycosphaerae TaxID=2950436 RepID=A0A9J6RJY5_9GAMM|nr:MULTISPECIES: DUF547 domain-containing protein [Dasania]MCR8921873.1 DUF547 domain-containing protein [Dasania sp. GY-MA-18]MCZ0864301.1 DUF547 domain-containing protein [Dasania phycosphaerae]MCZ0868029.1 DUF547 domain-containing protein [Dasania phycosphaerae]